MMLLQRSNTGPAYGKNAGPMAIVTDARHWKKIIKYCMQHQNITNTPQAKE